MTNEELMDAWRKGNNEARGFSVGDIDDTPEQAAERDGFCAIEDIDPEGAVSCEDGPHTIVVCDNNGPWGVIVATDASRNRHVKK